MFEPSFDTLICDVASPGVARITLNRPAQLNAYTFEMTQELLSAIALFRDENALRVMILRGAGERAFCAGGDIGEAEPRHRQQVAAAPMGAGREMRDGMQAVVRQLRALDKPTIAMLRGYAVAGGLALALSCDFRLADPGARLGDTSGRFALLPDEGGAWLFPRFMGYDKALRMTLLGEVYEAKTAADLGLITEVVDADLEGRTLAFAERLASRPVLSTRLAKMMMQRAQESTLDLALGDAQLAVMIANVSPDVRAATRSFRRPS